MSKCPKCKGTMLDLVSKCKKWREAKLGENSLEGEVEYKICLCPECNKPYLEYDNKLYTLGINKSWRLGCDSPTVCPNCYTEMVMDHETNIIRCPMPICGYSKQLEGYTGEEKRTIKKYNEMKVEVFRNIADDPSYQIPEEFIKLKREIDGFGRKKSSGFNIR